MGNIRNGRIAALRIYVDIEMIGPTSFWTICRELLAMQDKYSIGPVTLVQLVSLTAKPRIASAQADGAARTADTSPTFAVAGLGDELSQPVAEVASSFLNLKASPVLGLSADPARSHIALDAAVDRPVADATLPVFNPSDFQQFPPNINLPDAAGGGRGDTPLAGSDVSEPPAGIENDPIAGAADVPVLGYVFDGVDSFGDDQILDFSIAADDAKFPSNGQSSDLSSSAVEATYADYIASDWGSSFIIDCSGGVSLEPQLLNEDFVAPAHQISTNDAVPLI
jgi:hypothetical protein